MREIYINANLNPIAKFTSSSTSTKLKDILAWNISHKDHPFQHKNSYKLCNETGHPLLCDRKSMVSETTTWSELPNGGKATVQQKEEINKFKSAGLSESQSGIWVGKLTISVRLFEVEKLKQSSLGLPVPHRYVSKSLWWTLKSPKTNTLSDELTERT